MSVRKVGSSLLFRVVVAIILGVITGLFFPEWLARVFVTFNGLFSQFLVFFVPVLIFALITPAIAGLGKGAGKWLGITTGIAYLSTIGAGLLAYAVAVFGYPTLLGEQSLDLDVSDVEEGALTPYFEVEMAPPFEIMTALLLAFAVGLAMTAVSAPALYKGVREFEKLIMKVITAFVIPLLPLFIYGIFLNLMMNDNLGDVINSFARVLVLSVVMTWVVVILQYLLAGALSAKNPLTALKNMLPAYFTALGTSSSAATIPVTYKSVLKNGVAPNIAGFVVPLGATMHLSGSMTKLILYTFGIVYLSGMDVSFGLALGFMLLLGIMMVAAPGVPGGAVYAALGLLGSMLGFDEDMLALMIAAYIVVDSFGTAANITGDGAIALLINKWTKNGTAAEGVGLPDDYDVPAAGKALGQDSSGAAKLDEQNLT